MDIEHSVVHKGTDYHAAFPDVFRLHNGDIVAVFRETPVMPGTGVPNDAAEVLTHHHVAAGSRVTLIRSVDNGRTWDPDSKVVIGHPDSTRDINMSAISQLSSGELVVGTHRWFVNQGKERAEALGPERYVRPFRDGYPFDTVIFDSLCYFRSEDNGYTWGELEPVGTSSSLDYGVFIGKTGFIELPDGSLLAPLYGMPAGDTRPRAGNGEWRTRAYVARSRDGGLTWGRPSTVAYDVDGRIEFNEPTMVRLPDGKLLSMLRTTTGTGGYLYQVLSNDDGWTWQGLRRTPIWGYPAHLLRLRSGRILCTYGYRREPFGVRAAFSDDDGGTWDMDKEIVIRDDGLHMDLGYPASVQLKDDRVLSVYYFHGRDGIRYIGASTYEVDGR